MTQVIRRGISQGAADERYGAPLITADQGYFLFPGGGMIYYGNSLLLVSSNNQVRAIQTVLPYRLKVSDIQIVVTAASAQHTAGIGVYSADGATRLLQSGGISVGSTGVKKATLGTAVTLEPGPYWFAWTCTTNVARLQGVIANSNLNALFSDTVPQMGTSSNSGVAGGLPATLGTVTYGSFGIPFALMKP